MWNAVIDDAQPDFWPPRPSRFWKGALAPLRRFYLRRYYGVTEVVVEGADHLARLGPADGVLLAPNHSHDSDPHVMMEVGRRAHRPFAFMAAWQIFRTHWGLDGWVLQRMGAFSVDREGCDRRAIRQAVECLSGGHALVVFPEGEIYHLNDRLTPLLEGVAFMALTAQRELDKAQSPGRVWVVPAAIRYRYLDDVTPKLEEAVGELEARLFWKPRPGSTLHERIIQVGEVLLTIKEKEKLGRACDGDGDLPTRIARLREALLQRLENEHLKKSPSAETVPLRVKALRRHLLAARADDKADPAARERARAALDDVQLVLQLYSYPGDYLSEKPTTERMAETVEKFEEDIYGAARPKGRRRARVRLGEPIDLREASADRARGAAHDVTARLEAAIAGLMKA
ncbi:MAG TPA: lysophospholipid acyltransferase family protein, partial [Gemmataceae bacterium]|nr:lysophospholipid acyltransferase family protein [Gemmataceae bacterium]